MIDRSRAIRVAVRTLVARNGMHGTSMAAVAREAGVATGTAYVHYDSKEALIVATYLETKHDLDEAVLREVDLDAPPAERFAAMWRRTYGFLCEHPDHARYLQQFEASPYAAAYDPAAHPTRLAAEAARSDLAALLLALPPMVLFDLAFGPAIRAAANGRRLTAAEIETLVGACWRAITRPDDHP